MFHNEKDKKTRIPGIGGPFTVVVRVRVREMVRGTLEGCLTNIANCRSYQ
jgi:hypothetical protein